MLSYRMQKSAIYKDDKGKVHYKQAVILWENETFAITPLHTGNGDQRLGKIALVPKRLYSRVLYCSLDNAYNLIHMAQKLSRRFTAFSYDIESYRKRVSMLGKKRMMRACRYYQYLLNKHD